MKRLVVDGGWVCAYERLNNYSRIYPNSEAVTQAWQAIYNFYQTSYGANPIAGENLQIYFNEAGLENVQMQGFSKIISNKKDGALFSWYVEAAIKVLDQTGSHLLKNALLSKQLLAAAKKDYVSLLNSQDSFALEVTVATVGTK
jgi:hypothetical protein